jgi:hypothetical protein
MRNGIMILLLVAAMAMTGCSGEGGKEAFETAELEELQKNYRHAAKLYRQVIEKHPDSGYATKARERLTVLKNADN